MLGAIAGDMIGSPYEFRSWQGEWDGFPLFSEKSRFTDDSVLTFAVARALRESEDIDTFRNNLIDNFHNYARRYAKAGYGQKFAQWIISRDRKPYNSFGNGSAMRVSPVGWAFDTLVEVEKFAAASAEVTHNHPEGIKGACAVAASIFLARIGEGKEAIRSYVARQYGYDLNRSLEQIRQNYHFDETCQGSVSEAIIAFMESENFEESVRKAVWLRGDADTQAAIAGSIAEAFYGGVPCAIANETLNRLDANLHADFILWQAWLEQPRNVAGNND